MPVQLPTIDDEILYILDKWIQNSSQLITGTIGQNVVWNLAQFIKQNPENYKKASVVTAPNINYTTQSSECIIIFTNNSAGSFDFGDNIWNKWYVVNATDNIRTIAGGKFYYDINGVAQTSISARKSILIAKGNDDFWYEVYNTTGGSSGTQKQPKSFVVGTTPNAPVANTTSWTLGVFADSWVVLFVGNLLVDMTDSGDGSPYISKILTSQTLTINNYTFQNGDKLSYILITP